MKSPLDRSVGWVSKIQVARTLHQDRKSFKPVLSKIESSAMPADYTTWLGAVFDHPATEPDWCWADNFDDNWEALGSSDEVLVEYLTRLFRDPTPFQGTVPLEARVATNHRDGVSREVWRALTLMRDVGPLRTAQAVCRRSAHG